MGIIRFLSPINFWKNLTLVVRNFMNLRYYSEQVRDLETKGLLKQYGMRRDSRNRLYYVINLEPEILLMGKEVLELEKSKVYESITLRRPMLDDAGLTELIEIKTERIKDQEYYAYLIQIKYRPMTGWREMMHSISWPIVASILTAYALRLVVWATGSTIFN